MLALKNFGPKALAEVNERLQTEGSVPVEEEAPIEVLDLSTRTYNCLEQAGIATVEEILKKLAEGNEEMLAIKNFGPKSLAELKERLQAKGFVPVEKVAEVEEIEAVVEEPVEAVKEEVVELAAPKIEEVAEEVTEAVPVEEEVLVEEVKPAEEPIEEEKPTEEYGKEEEGTYEYEEKDELEERKKREKRRELVYDEELGKMVAKRHRKPGRQREEWEDY